MVITLDNSFEKILINGVNFESLLHVKCKDVFTVEDRRHEDFTKFFKRYDYKDERNFDSDEVWKWGVQHMD